VPGHYVEGREVLLGLEQKPLEFVHHSVAGMLGVVVPCDGSLEVSWVGQPIGTCKTWPIMSFHFLDHQLHAAPLILLVSSDGKGSQLTNVASPANLL
jgi:hypothetical protein